MNDYDATLKILLREGANATIRAISDRSVVRWLNAEYQVVEERRIDLLGETEDGLLLHLELQSGHEPDMPWRLVK